MKRKKSKRLMHDCRGFSLIEVLLGITIFMIGMLGVTALNISSLKSNTFSGNLSEATFLASTKIEELMAMEFDEVLFFSDVDNDGSCQTCTPFVNQDADDDGIDDDAAAPGTHDADANFGLDDFGADADYADPPTGKNLMYTVYWNVAESEPITVTPQRTKTINVIVEWFVKDEPRRISMSVIRMKEE
jgi:prepilin-type N-terminal cleavage/methylation domain-containing protein